YRKFLGDNFRGLGSVYASTNQPDQAVDAYVEAIKVMGPLVERHPRVVPYKYGLAGGHSDLGNFLASLGTHDKAREHYDQAVLLLEPILRGQPAHPMARDHLRNALLGRSQTLSRLGRHPAALQDLDRLAKLGNGSMTVACQLTRARVLGRMGNHREALS